MSEKYYTPKLLTEEPVRTDNAGFAGDLPDGAKDGFVSTSVEQDVVIQRISRDLYASPQSGIRELYANEARACRTALKQNHSPEIRLTIRENSRQIILHGINSSGMSWETFRDVYCVLGRSTNFDGKESGQFGFGRAAYTCISDIMILETYCRDTGEKYAVMGKSGVGFQTGLPTPNLDTPGTRVTITARKDVDLQDIINMVKSCAKLSGIKTIIDADGRYEEQSGEICQKSLKSIVRLRNSYKYNVYSQAYAHLFSDDDLEVAVFFGKRHDGVPDYLQISERESYLCGIPIQYSYTGGYRHGLSNIAVNIKDERKYQPTPDRERLKDESAKAIDDRIDKMITGLIASLPVPSFAQYVKDSKYRIVDCAFDHINPASPLYSYARLLNINATSHDKPHTNLKIGSMINDGNFIMDTVDAERLRDAIHEQFPEQKILIFGCDDSKEPETLACCGILSATEFAQKHGIVAKKDPKVRVYSAIDPEGLLEPIEGRDHIVLIGPEFDHLNNTLYEKRGLFKRAFRYAKKDDVGERNTTWPTLQQWSEKRLKTKIATSEGIMSISEILADNRPIRYVTPSSLHTELAGSSTEIARQKQTDFCLNLCLYFPDYLLVANDVKYGDDLGNNLLDLYIMSIVQKRDIDMLTIRDTADDILPKDHLNDEDFDVDEDDLPSILHTLEWIQNPHIKEHFVKARKLIKGSGEEFMDLLIDLDRKLSGESK